ncbi:MAG: hypothetical protein GY795_11255 [Desulfobacterales bacterium]|nr:hypothetical protein [Desulfobacterales bacterium]
MAKTDYIENIKEIRSIMERSTKFISLSGLSGIAAGLVGIIAAGLAMQKLGSLILEPDVFALIEKSPGMKNYFLILFSITFGAALFLSFFFTLRKARKNSLKIWDNTSRRFLFNMFFPLAAGGAFVMAMLYHGIYSLICAVMLIFYGVSLLNASKYTNDEIRYLGILEVVAGIAASFFIGYGLVLWGIGFGVLNAVYGIIMYVKYEK